MHYILVLLTLCQSQLTPICFIGENLYGDYSPFSDQFDPRPVMGTYKPTDLTNPQTTSLSIDFTAQIYQHKNYDEHHSYRTDDSNYIFKVVNIGWVVSTEVLPSVASESNILATCFENNLYDCTTHSWFGGYNNNRHPLCSLKIMDGQCASDICINNFNMTLSVFITPSLKKDKTYILNGILKAVSPTEPCTMDSNVCDSNRTYWINQNDTSYRWYYRVTKNANWVYGRSGSDKIACDPGYVESPLFCTTFVYASDIDDNGNRTDYELKAGACDSFITAPCPTNDPTGYPSSNPTVTSVSPSVSPTANPSVNKANLEIIAVAVVTVVICVICSFMHIRKRKKAKKLNNVNKDGKKMNSSYNERKNSNINKGQKRNKNETLEIRHNEEIQLAGTNNRGGGGNYRGNNYRGNNRNYRGISNRGGGNYRGNNYRGRGGGNYRGGGSNYRGNQPNNKKSSPHTTLGAVPNRIDLKPSAPVINNNKSSPNHTTLGAVPNRIDPKPSAPVINKQTGRTEGDDENIEYKYNKPSAPYIDYEEKSIDAKLYAKYYVGQRLMVKISKVAKSSATVIFAENISKWIVVKYDLYCCDDGKNTEKLHIIDDAHRIEIRETNTNEESIKYEIDKDQPIENDKDEDNHNNGVQNEVEKSQTKSIEKECVICMDKNKNHICVPCGHECVCEDCKDLIDGKCPICRSECTTTIRVFR